MIRNESVWANPPAGTWVHNPNNDSFTRNRDGHIDRVFPVVDNNGARAWDWTYAIEHPDPHQPPTVIASAPVLYDTAEEAMDANQEWNGA